MNDKFDLEERCARFAERIIDLCKRIKITPLNRKIIPLRQSLPLGDFAAVIADNILIKNKKYGSAQ